MPSGGRVSGGRVLGVGYPGGRVSRGYIPCPPNRKSSWYSSYWNAFLFVLFSNLSEFHLWFLRLLEDPFGKRVEISQHIAKENEVKSLENQGVNNHSSGSSNSPRVN